MHIIKIPRLRGRHSAAIALAGYLHCDPNDIVLTAGAFGKPKLARPRCSVEFSVSHSAGRCLVAIYAAGLVGVDVERRRCIGDFEGVAATYFTPEEAVQIAESQGEARLKAFFACWTFKEAYSKAIGAGLLTPFDTFALPAPSSKTASCTAIQGRQWTHLRFEPWAGYTATVVAAGRLTSSAFAFEDFDARRAA